MPKTAYLQSGFTLVELLVVFSVMGILSIGAIASYVSFNNSQVFSNTALDVKTTFTLAQSRAGSQVKPSACGVKVLNGYEVRICGNGASCTAGNDYELHANCGSGGGLITPLISAGHLPNGITFSNQPASPFLFPSLIGPVTSGSFKIKNGSQTKTISVSATGVVTIQ